MQSKNQNYSAKGQDNFQSPPTGGSTEGTKEENLNTEAKYRDGKPQTSSAETTGNEDQTALNMPGSKIAGKGAPSGTAESIAVKNIDETGKLPMEQSQQDGIAEVSAVPGKTVQKSLDTSRDAITMKDADRGGAGSKALDDAVSYTHLTLPTIYSV